MHNVSWRSVCVYCKEPYLCIADIWPDIKLINVLPIATLFWLVSCNYWEAHFIGPDIKRLANKLTSLAQWHYISTYRTRRRRHENGFIQNRSKTDGTSRDKKKTRKCWPYFSIKLTNRRRKMSLASTP